MSKINKIRFVNLNYNYNTMKIDDESFYLDGENTMLNLKNGGGKSVLVQMIMAPFVNRRYRSIKDRAFESYFTSTVPTFILVEWSLDDGAGFLLTGMVVRKKDSVSDEDSKEKLDIVNFVYEYREKNQYDINNIPIIEEKDNRKIIKSFTSCKTLFENLKKDRTLKFNYYDMNNPVTTKNYFSKLGEYKINYREWETIIKQINIKESGLSELFTKAKDSSGLVREWFLPAVENKLKNDEDRIDNYRILLDRYIKQYRQNKSNIDKNAKLELFNNLSKEVLLCCNEFLSTVQKKEEKINYIANVISYLKEQLDDKEKEEAAFEELTISLNDKINDLNYEEESIKIYKKQEELDNFKIKLEKQKDLVNISESRKNALIRKVNVLECANIHKHYQNASRELQENETKLRILNKKQQDNASYINNLGFNIREILEKELYIMQKEKADKINLKGSLQEERRSIDSSIKDNQKEANTLRERRGGLTSTILSFDQLEDSFNRNYGLTLVRNIEGYFDEAKVFTIDKKIKDEGLELNKEKIQINDSLLDEEEKLKSRESEKYKNIGKISDVENKLSNKNSELKSTEEEMEKRKEIIKYIDFGEDKIFDNKGIVYAFNKKIEILREEETSLKKAQDYITNEIIKLKTGKVLELPKDIEHEFKQKDINITYGMDWLKKNGYPFEKNEKLVKENPFIPYSLIMDSKEIEILEKESLNLFTSSPISIINRKDLEKSFNNSNEAIVNLVGMRFLISFNKKLLNESELLSLIIAKEAEEEAVKINIDKKQQDIGFYEEKRNLIKYSSITFETYDELKKEINLLKEEAINLRQIEIDIEKEISSIEDKLRNYRERVEFLKISIQNNTKKEKAFKELLESYEQYRKNKSSLERINERISILQNYMEKSEIRKREIEKEIDECINAITHYNIKEEKAIDDFSKFNMYKDGVLMERDKEDLISEYNALTKDISVSEKELHERIRELSLKFKETEEELNLKTNKYNIKEAEYINETYDIHKELEVKDELEKENSNYNSLKDDYNRIENSMSFVSTKLKELYKDLKDKFNKEEPKAKSLLIDKNFKMEVERLKLQIKKTNSKITEINKIKVKIQGNLSSLNEFNDLSIIDKVDVDIDLSELDTVIGKLKRDLNIIKDEEAQREKKLTSLVTDIENKDEFKSESLFKEPIQTLKILLGKPREFKEQLNLITGSYELIMQKLMADIELIEKEEGKILESILEYIKDVHENIEKIDDNSTITIGTRRLKMLNITASDWSENKELYKIRLRDYIEQIRNQSIKTLEQNEDIEDIISNNININKLYDEVVGIGTVSIKLYKIEEDKQKTITWDEVSKNSGGEGFLSAFVILSSLLSYMRKDESDIFSRRESGKVIIMDNPFAQTNSAHLLKPLIDIAKKSNTQLICLTGLGGDSIYNRFDNIYVLNLVPSKLHSGIKYLRSEHTKGEDEQEVIVATRFTIQEQIKLF